MIILWDFDGVLMDSNAIRDFGFKKVLSQFPENEVTELLDFHHKNGGLSRHVKFRYFFENIRKEHLTDDILTKFTDAFSVIMKELLVNPDLLINETLEFVKNKHTLYPMHITSGSDEKELNQICAKLYINQYFKSIHGSPTPKKDLVKNVLNEFNYKQSECLLIGDSINDYEAAKENGISFMAYNNSDLEKYTDLRISLY